MEARLLRRNAQFVGKILLAGFLIYLATHSVQANANNFITGTWNTPNLEPIGSPTKLYEAESVLNFLNPTDDNIFPRVAYQLSQDDLMTTVRFQNYAYDLPILNTQSYVHLGDYSEKQVVVVGCNEKLFVNDTPALSEAEARHMATEFLGKKYFKSSDINSTTLAYQCFEKRKTNELVYKVYFEPSELTDSTNVLVNAHTGAIEKTWLTVNPKMHRRISELEPIDPKDRYKKIQNRFNSGYTYKVLLNDEDNSLSSQDQSALEVFAASKKIYDYFSSTFGRDSYDDAGARIDGIVHFGKSLNNAFFHPGYQALFFGDGDGVNFNSFTSSSDVIAHEFTHMLVYKTSSLQGSGEAGSLNESVADFFGARVSNIADWKIGREIFKRQSPLSYVRDMKYPETKGKPGHYDDRRFAGATHCNKANDNCGAHVNVGIPNKATVAMAEILGIKQTEQIFYHAINHYYFKTMSFKDAKKALKKSCRKLFVNSSTDCGAVDKAWESVGVN